MRSRRRGVTGGRQIGAGRLFGRIALSVLLLGTLAACGSSGEDRRDSGHVAAIWREQTVITAEGRLQGPPSTPGRCRLLLPTVGDPFALIGSTEPFGPGARVRVTGPIAVWSACDTYRTLRVDQVAPAG